MNECKHACMQACRYVCIWYHWCVYKIYIYGFGVISVYSTIYANISIYIYIFKMSYICHTLTLPVYVDMATRIQNIDRLDICVDLCSVRCFAALCSRAPVSQQKDMPDRNQRSQRCSQASLGTTRVTQSWCSFIIYVYIYTISLCMYVYI